MSELIQLQQQSEGGFPETQGSVLLDDDAGYEPQILPEDDETL